MPSLIVIDTETSDLDPTKGAAVLELAWIKLKRNNEHWEPVENFEGYMEYDGPISPHARATHHIRPEQLTVANGAMSFNTALLNLMGNTEDDTVYVAHNVDFDSKFLPIAQKPWVCTMRAAKHVWPNAPGYSNQVLRYWLGVEPDIKFTNSRYPHQALYDVATTTAILLKMLEKHTVKELHQFTYSPVRLKTINFGKHKGAEFDHIPVDYLRWLRNQPELDQDLKHTLDTVIAER